MQIVFCGAVVARDQTGPKVNTEAWPRLAGVCSLLLAPRRGIVSNFGGMPASSMRALFQSLILAMVPWV
jgi:hypothetical protein